MSASLYKPMPTNNSLGAWQEYARQLEFENSDLRVDLDYEMKRSQTLRELNMEAVNQEILKEYRDSNNNIIFAIKRARYLMGIGLLEAKEYTLALISS